MHTRRRYATCPQGMPKKKRKEKDSPYPRKKRGRKRDHANEFIHHLPNKKKYPHTCTSWSRLMTYFSFGSDFWLSKIWEASLPSYPPYLQLHKKKPLGVRWKRKVHKRPWWGLKHLEHSKRIKWGAKQDFFWKLIKKSQATWHKELRWLDSRPFHSSTTRDGMIDTSKFTSARCHLEYPLCSLHTIGSYVSP